MNVRTPEAKRRLVNIVLLVGISLNLIASILQMNPSNNRSVEELLFGFGTGLILVASVMLFKHRKTAR